MFKKLFKKIKARRLARNDVIVLYGIFKKKDPSFQGFSEVNPSPAELMKHYTPVTVAPTRKDVKKAIDKLIYFNHFDHFTLWCYAHGYKDTCAWVYPTWDQYKRDVLSKDDLKEEASQYSMFPLIYTRGDVASLIRTISQCDPLLLPYEKDIELPTYLTRHATLPDHLATIIATDTVDGAKLRQFFSELQHAAEEQNKKSENN